MPRKAAPRQPVPLLKWAVRMVAAEIEDAMILMEPAIAKGRSDPTLKGDPNYELAKFALPWYAAQLKELERMEEWLDSHQSQDPIGARDLRAYLPNGPVFVKAKSSLADVCPISIIGGQTG